MKVDTSSGLNGEATPPPAVSLICDAPCNELLASAQPNLIGTIRDHTPPTRSMRVSRPPIVRGRSERVTQIPVSACDRNKRA